LAHDSKMKPVPTEFRRSNSFQPAANLSRLTASHLAATEAAGAEMTATPMMSTDHAAGTSDAGQEADRMKTDGNVTREQVTLRNQRKS